MGRVTNLIIERHNDPETQWRQINRANAKRLGHAGFTVFPARSSDAGPDKILRAKSPLARKMGSCTQTDIDDLWRKFPDAVPAIELGKCDFFVVDLDRHGGPDGVAEWKKLASRRGQVPVTFCETPTGGFHLYFRQPDGPLGNREGALAGLGINVRGVGGYVIAPGSIMADGRSYGPLDASEIAAAPDAPRWLLDMIGGGRAAPATVAPLPRPAGLSGDARSVAWADAAFNGEVAAVAQMSKGGRNNQLNTSSFRIGQLIDAGAFTVSDALAALSQAARDCGLWRDDGASQCVTTINSGLASGRRNPRTPPVSLTCGSPVAAPTVAPSEDADPITIGDIENILGFRFDGDPAVARRTAIIKKILPREGTGILGGQSRAGKSFVAIDLAVAVASGQQFFGRDVRTLVGVAYLAGEGGYGIQDRIDAAKLSRGLGGTLPIAWTADVGNLLDPKNAAIKCARLAQISKSFEVKFGLPLGLIIIDTVSASYAMKNENDNSEVAAVCRAMADMGGSLDAFVLSVHHYGKDPSQGLRGGSGWRGNVDMVYALIAERDEQGVCVSRSLHVEKNREGEEGPLGRFSLAWSTLSTDEDGDPVGSMSVMLERVLSRTGQPVSMHAEAFDAAVRLCGTECAFEHVTPDGELIPVVLVESVRRRFYGNYPAGQGDPKKRLDTLKKEFQACLSGYLSKAKTSTGFTRDSQEYIPLN